MISKEKEITNNKEPKCRVNIVFLRDTPCKICECPTMMKVQSIYDFGTKRKVSCPECHTLFACPKCCREIDHIEETDKAAWIEAQFSRHIKPLKEFFMTINSNYYKLFIQDEEVDQQK